MFIAQPNFINHITHVLFKSFFRSGQLAPIPPSVLPVIRREEGDKAKPQVDETQKDELLTYFDYLIKTEGKRAEEAYRIIAEQCGKSMKTNILRWKKERLDAQDAGESRSDGRRSNSDFDEAVLEKMTQRNPNIDFVEAVDGSNSSMRYSHEMIQQAAKDVLTTDWRFKDDKRLEALNFSGAWCSHFIGRVGLPKRKIVRKGKDTSASIV